jgi:DNA-binding transcriptional MocR family regulator
MILAMTNPLEHLYAPRAAGMNASEIRELLKLLDNPGIISFAGGIPDPALFPSDVIEQLAGDILRSGAASQALQYSISEGYLPLRRWIAGYMREARGVACEAENILITAGSQQGIDLIGKLLVAPGDIVLVERPTYLGFLQAMRAYEPQWRELAIGKESCATPDLAPGEAARARVAYLIPDFANPTGRTLDLAQRQAALECARALDIAVIEDAAYGDLGHDGQRHDALLRLDCDAVGGIDRSRVLYCGTFSKIFAPGLRVGWICGARAVIEKLVLVKQASDLHVSTLNQMLMERLAAQGFEAQCARNRRAYAERKGWMVEALARHMPQDVRWVRPEGGMFVWLELPAGFDGAALLERAVRDFAVAFVPGAPFFIGTPERATIRLSFSLASREQIFEGVRRLAELIASEREAAA